MSCFVVRGEEARAVDRVVVLLVLQGGNVHAAEGGATANTVGDKRSDGGKVLASLLVDSFVVDRELESETRVPMSERKDLHLDFLPRLTTS